MTKASRFAVLRIENDEEERAAQSLKDKQKAAAEKLSGKKGHADKSGMLAERNAAKKTKAAQEKAELKALAFGGSKPKKSSASKKKAVVTVTAVPTDWNEWKQRDQNFVEGSYEHQLEEALLASKIDYEEKKEVYDLRKTEKEVEPSKKKGGTNKKGTTTMSLDQFNQVPQIQEAKKSPPGINDKQIQDEDHFFEQVSEEAKKLAGIEKSRADANKKKPNKPKEMSEGPRLAQIQEELRKSNEEVEVLRQENEKLREELLNVKTRNKRLCNILVQGEMKEKAELLVEMEKMTKVKDELTSELDMLSSQLQQERSKVTALTDAKKIAGHKK